MKLLIAPIGTVYDDGKNLYTTSDVLTQIDRYKFMGDEISILMKYKKTDNPVGKKIDLSDGKLNIIYVRKINSVKSFLFDNRVNDKIIKQAVKQADICVCHVPCSTSAQTVKYARKYGKPYINIVVACPWDSLWNYDWRGKLMAPFSFLSLRKIQSQATHSIYVTKYFLQSRYPTKGNQLGISDVQLEKTSEEILYKRLDRLKRLPENVKNFSIATAAALIPYKGQRYVVKAISELKKRGIIYTYHVIGPGDQTALKKLASDLGVEKQVIFYGMVSHEEVARILDSVDLYIQPSLQEGLPRAMVEAMSRGCVALGSNIAGIPELVGPDFLFPKKDVDSIVRILADIDRNKLIELSEINFNKAKEYDTDLLQVKAHEFLKNFVRTAES